MTAEAQGAPAPESVYLDHAAATPLRDEVATAMEEVRRRAFANPSSPHAAGRLAKRTLEDARERILELLGATPGTRLVFTSGASEANRLGILGALGHGGGWVSSSPRDHASVSALADELAARGGRLHALALGPDGTVDPASIPPADHAGGRHVLAVTLVCGQTGSIEDVGRLAPWTAAAPGRFLHVDAVQAVVCGTGAADGIGAAAGPAATLVVAPHKFGGPRGIGGLVVHRDLHLEPVAPGPQEGGVRGGTEPVVLAVGFARALELAVAEQAALACRLRPLRDALEAALVTAAGRVGIAATVVGGAARRAPHITTIAFAGVDRQALVMAADLAGVACATGTACASGSSEPAPAVAATVGAGGAAGAVRFSLGRDTSARQIDLAAARIGGALTEMAGRRPTLPPGSGCG